ncbi:transposase [Mycobacterium sp. PO1]|nr:transposase [Mycobacterium sp. PO1]GFM24856.1 transposase [Mycobacterium sp. PO2]
MAPSTYYDAKTRPPSARAQRDAVLGPALRQLWKDNYQVCFIVDAHSRMIVGGG